MEEKSPKRIQTHFDDEVFLYPNGNYYYRGTPLWSKKRLEFSLGLKKGATQKEILSVKDEKLEDLKASGATNLKDNFRGLSVPYLKDRKEEAENPELLSQSSLAECETMFIKHLNPFFGNFLPHQIDQPLFEEYCMAKRKQKVKWRKKIGLNLKNHRKVLNHFMKWLFHRKAIKNLVTFEIPKKARVKHRERIVPEDKEVLAIFKFSTGNLLIYVVLYALMGLRNMEILGLAWADIDFVKNTIFVRGENNRTRKDRSVPMNDFVRSLLLAKKALSISKWVFPRQKDNKRHMYKSAMQMVFKRMLVRAKVNLDLTPHDLRAFFETHMSQNKDFTDTQREKMAGADIDVQKKIYIKMQAEGLRGLENSVKIEGLSDLLSSKIESFNGGTTGGRIDNSRPSKSLKTRKNTGKRKDI